MRPSSKSSARFLVWWRAPITRRDRMIGAWIGAFAGFWLGFLGRIALGPMPVSGSTVLAWGAGASVCVAVLGIAFPKTVSIALFPFATFGPG
jgi:hypothetical protein